MPMPLISIIVPIYNGEKYLSKCLDSILAQRFEDFELLLINDGSQDSSLSICRKYAQADKRISIYDIPNGGVSAARNVGIDNATGEWVMFIDSDDWVEEGLLETGLPYFNEYDMIDIATYIDETISGTEYKQFPLPKNTDQFIRHIIRRKTRLSVWGIFIRRTILEQYHIRFDTTYNYAEDWHMLLQLAMKCNRVKLINDTFPYHYNMLNDSNCSNTISVQKLANNIRFLRYARTQLKGRFGRAIDFTKIGLYHNLIGKFDKEQLCNHLLTINDEIEFYTLWDIIKADFGVKTKIALYNFMRYANSKGLTASSCNNRLHP